VLPIIILGIILGAVLIYLAFLPVERHAHRAREPLSKLPQSDSRREASSQPATSTAAASRPLIYDA
jgi:hypothetical protein